MPWWQQLHADLTRPGGNEASHEPRPQPSWCTSAYPTRSASLPLCSAPKLQPVASMSACPLRITAASPARPVALTLSPPQAPLPLWSAGV